VVAEGRQDKPDAPPIPLRPRPIRGDGAPRPTCLIVGRRGYQVGALVVTPRNFTGGSARPRTARTARTRDPVRHRPALKRSRASERRARAGAASQQQDETCPDPVAAAPVPASFRAANQPNPTPLPPSAKRRRSRHGAARGNRSSSFPGPGPSETPTAASPRRRLVLTPRTRRPLAYVAGPAGRHGGRQGVFFFFASSFPVGGSRKQALTNDRGGLSFLGS
jgi:hypothetical protein